MGAASSFALAHPTPIPTGWWPRRWRRWWRASRRGDGRPEPAAGNLYGKGSPLPDSLGTALALATQDDTILEILGADSVLDFADIARSEWLAYQGHVSDWERRRYLASS